jgi:hypothetical protein
MIANVSTTKLSYIDVFQYSIKKSGQFTCVGWINNPIIPDDNSLVLLAVSDLSGTVVDSDAAIRFEIVRDGGDFRLQFSNALSKKITASTGVFPTDEHWHFVSYVGNEEGIVKFYVDGIEVPPEDGTGPDGMLYSTAWSRSVRQGGGSVWVPYLYTAGQSVSIYNWRFGKGFQIHQEWLKQLMAVDLPILEPNQ